VLLLLLREDIAADLHVSGASLDTAIGVGLMSSAVGAVLFAQLGDRFGRTRALALAVLVYSLGTGAMALSWDVWSLVGFRALSGIGTGGEWSLGFALISEVWRSKRRGAIGGVVQSMFNVGTIVGVLLGLAFGSSWRVVFGLATLPALGVAYIRLRVPESKLWVRMQVARRDGTVPPDLAEAMRRAPLGEIFRGRLLKVTLAASALFTLMNYSFYIFGSHIAPFVTAPVGAGGLGWTRNQAGPVFMAMTLVGGLSAGFSGYLSDLYGRRRVFSTLCGFGALAFTALFFVLRHLDPDRPAAFWVAVVAVSAAYGINGVVGALFAELYPTHLRATGPGFVSNLGKFLAGGAPLLGGWLIHAFGAADPRFGWSVGLSAPALCYVGLTALIWSLPRVTGREMDAVERDAFLERPA